MRLCSEIPVYNVETFADHTYFVGDAGIWVHNGCMDAHHAFPKFLGGNRNGLTRQMDSVLHQKGFHPTLMRSLRTAGVKRAASNQKWHEYFNENPDKVKVAIDVLFDVSRDYERRFGHLISGSLTEAIWRQLMAHGKVLAP